MIIYASSSICHSRQICVTFTMEIRIQNKIGGI